MEENTSINLIPFDKKKESDLEEMLILFKEYYPGSPFLPDYEDLKYGKNIYFRAFFQGEFVGFSGISFKTPLLAETIKTTVLKTHRSRGLGKLISLEIERECARRGVKKVMSTIYSSNHTMIQIKLKQGYVIEGFHLDHEAPGFHEYSLGKILK